MSLISRFGKAVVTLGVVATLGSTFSAHARTAGIAEGPAPDLFLLYTGDVIGHIEPCG